MLTAAPLPADAGCAQLFEFSVTSVRATASIPDPGSKHDSSIKTVWITEEGEVASESFCQFAPVVSFFIAVTP